MARWNSCNVLHVGADARRLWHFDARSGKFPLNREQTSRADEPLPASLIAKSWSTLWQPAMNVAWLPPEHVFIRVTQIPRSSPDETRAMIELQLEKLSPLPLTQAVWSMHILPNSGGDMQTVVVVIASRNAVEAFLGKLETQGFLADRLEVPLLDQLEAAAVHEDGAWIYPESEAGTALVAWWYGGVLHNLGLLTLPSTGDAGAGLRDQLMQMAWAGELEGWLAGPPRWRLVANEETAAKWNPPLRQGLDQPVEVVPPLSGSELAARTAKRAVHTDSKHNLLPAEFSARYRQQFVDRLWMRALLAVFSVYVTGTIIYFIAVAFLNYRTQGVEAQVRRTSLSYTNALHLKAQYDILKNRQELKYAALDCWEAVAELLPENVTLDTLNFNNGEKLSLGDLNFET